MNPPPWKRVLLSQQRSGFQESTPFRFRIHGHICCFHPALVCVQESYLHGSVFASSFHMDGLYATVYIKINKVRKNDKDAFLKSRVCIYTFVTARFNCSCHRISNTEPTSICLALYDVFRNVECASADTKWAQIIITKSSNISSKLRNPSQRAVKRNYNYVTKYYLPSHLDITLHIHSMHPLYPAVPSSDATFSLSCSTCVFTILSIAIQLRRYTRTATGSFYLSLAPLSSFLFYVTLKEYELEVQSWNNKIVH
jgi:hypothetical protein